MGTASAPTLGNNISCTDTVYTLPDKSLICARSGVNSNLLPKNDENWEDNASGHIDTTGENKWVADEIS